MKINDKNKNYTTYGEIRIGECFKYNSGIYIKSKNVGNADDIYDVNLENGLISPPLPHDVQVIYLPNATVNMYGGE